MSEAELHHGSGDCGADVAAYALGALSPAEAQAFREHLADCVVCRDEVSALGAVVDTLPLAAPPQRVPRALRRRVLAEVRAEAGGARGRRQRDRRGPRGRWRPVLAGGLAAVAAAAAALVIALAGGGSATRVLSARTTVPGSHAQLRVGNGQAELVFQRMPPPPAGRVYQVWLKRSNQPPVPTTALFSTTRSGAGTVAVPGGLNGISQVMVTAEPAGGSRSPTSAPVMVANL